MSDVNYSDFVLETCSHSLHFNKIKLKSELPWVYLFTLLLMYMYFYDEKFLTFYQASILWLIVTPPIYIVTLTYSHVICYL